MIHRTVIRLCSSALLAAFVLGCGDDEPTAPSGPFLEVTPLFTGVDAEGGTIQLSASLAGEPVAVSWESSDPAVATVSPTGLVTGLVAGRAAATATLADGSQKRSASITVVALTGTPLQNGVPVTGLSGTANGQTKLYRISVPAGKTNLSVVLSGGTGDADIFVRRQTPPTSSSFTCASDGATTAEVCDIPNPAAGTWYILVVSFVYSGASLTATYTP